MKKYIQAISIAVAVFIAVVPALSQSGVVQVTKWGEFGDKPGQFKFPTMLAVNKDSEVYVVDQHNHRIQKFDSNGNFILMWGRLGTGAGEFNYPYGIAIDSKGDVYVSDMNNNRIQKFSPKGDYIS
ncbi:MAG TPA: 6-bladed beta-propeller, partial [Chitinophagaceae bacterium]|nr:6-bladed beta-propeller [Chitinophagaceae bacterium]